jgi:hypothetical protein
MVGRLTPQFGGRALPRDARRERIMKWRARAVAATTCHDPLLAILVSRRRALEQIVRICLPSVTKP